MLQNENVIKKIIRLSIMLAAGSLLAVAAYADNGWGDKSPVDFGGVQLQNGTDGVTQVQVPVDDKGKVITPITKVRYMKDGKAWCGTLDSDGVPTFEKCKPTTTFGVADVAHADPMSVALF